MWVEHTKAWTIPGTEKFKPYIVKKDESEREFVYTRLFTENGWTDYIYWQTEDKKTLKKINTLIEDICRNGNEGIGKPESLSGNLSGYWSRRINDKDRLIYKIDADYVYILASRYYYSDK